MGQNVCRDKMSGRTKHPEGQNDRKTKRLWGQNVRRQKILLTYFQYRHIKNFKNNTLFWIASEFFSLYTWKESHYRYFWIKNGNIRLHCWYLFTPETIIKQSKQTDTSTGVKVCMGLVEFASMLNRFFKENKN